MENAVDALKMAGSVLLFVIGLTIAILAFSQAREAIDSVLRFSDREAFTMQDEEVRKRFYYLSNENDTNRYVGLETIIPSIYRSYKENYKIVFEFPDDYYLYQDRETGLDIKEIDAVNMPDPKEFIDGILYHEYETNESDFRRKFGIVKMGTESLYNYIVSHQTQYNIKESLGVYVQDEIRNPNQVDNTDDEFNISNAVPDRNKYRKRIITYSFVIPPQ